MKLNEKQAYLSLLADIKNRIQLGQTRVTHSIHIEMTEMYWEIGKMLDERQQLEGWGAGIIPELAKGIVNEIPEVKGFSERNLKRMLRFYREYSTISGKSEPGLKVPQAVAQLPWGHNTLLFEKIKDVGERFWYAEQILLNGWSRDSLAQMIKSEAFKRQGKVISNFNNRLPEPQSTLAQETLKDPYVFDFLTLSEPFKERELETELLKHLEKFLLELGDGFAFVGRQYHVEVSDQEFYIDLLFYHLRLRSFVVVELKRGDFKPEYAGKMNFYCSVVDDKLKHSTDQPTIGLILCQTKDRILAEYALRDIAKPIGVSEYELTRSLPDNLKGSLPSIEELELELTSDI